VAAFARDVETCPRWMVLWAAGVGVTGTPESALAAETATWRLFLDLVGKHLAPLTGGSPGSLFLASSAGSVYGDNAEQPLTEESSPSPISPYGRAKLRQEEVLRDWARHHGGISYLIGRISNLYGPGQNLGKSQGLISHISRCLIYHRPLHLYVPLDTIRDYIAADACADHIVTCLNYLSARSPSGVEGRGEVKIVASEQETSLAQIIGTFARVSHRHLKVIRSPSPAAQLQPLRLKYRSLLWRQLGTPSWCSLEAGIKRLHQHHLALYAQGRLSPCG
jgi:UDP-glucose 4-epimerase